MFQRDKARSFRGVQPFQSGGDEDAVLAGERDEIGNSAQRDEIEQRAQIIIRCAGKVHLASAFDECVCELEGEADRTEFTEVGSRRSEVRRCRLRIDESDSSGRW